MRNECLDEKLKKLVSHALCSGARVWASGTSIIIQVPIDCRELELLMKSYGAEKIGDASWKIH